VLEIENSRTPPTSSFTQKKQHAKSTTSNLPIISIAMGGQSSHQPLIEQKDGVVKSINIMILGKPGIGKSTLVNGLLGKTVAKISPLESIETRGYTRVVQFYSLKNNGIKGVVYDTPWLLDSILETDVIQEVKKVFPKVDLFLLCIRMSHPRIIEGD